MAGGVKVGQNIAKNAARAVNPMQNCWLRSPVEAPKWVKDTINGPQMISPIDLSLFPGSLSYLGASSGLQSQKICMYRKGWAAVAARPPTRCDALRVASTLLAS